MTRVALEAAAFALPLADIDARFVAAAMDAGIELHEDAGFVWSAQGMAALLALRERAEVIIALDAVDFALTEILLGWGLGVTQEPLDSLSDVAVTIDTAPLSLTERMALDALEVA